MRKGTLKFRQFKSEDQSIDNLPLQKISFIEALTKIKTIITQKSIVSFLKFNDKLTQIPSVFVNPPLKKLNQASQSKAEKGKTNFSINKLSSKQKLRANSHLSQKDESKLKELMNKKHQLMDRLKKIDQQLYRPIPILQAYEPNDSRLEFDMQKLSHIKNIESRLKSKNNQSYSVMQYQKNIEMLSRINVQKLKRQEKIVTEMKKKQEHQLKKLDQIQKNRSQLQISRQMPLIHIQKQTTNYTLESVEPISHIINTFQPNKNSHELDSLDELPMHKKTQTDCLLDFNYKTKTQEEESQHPQKMNFLGLPIESFKVQQSYQSKE